MVTSSLGSIAALVGAFGPPVLAIVTIGSVISSGVDTTGLVLLFIWQPVNIGINTVLKWVVDENRPLKPIHVNQLERMIDTGTKGMPSGHAQMSSSVVVLAYRLSRPAYLIVAATAQCMITLWQRHAYRKHTLIQLAFGLFAGFLYSLFFSNFVTKHMTEIA